VTETVVYTTDTSDLHLPHDMFRTAFGGARQVVEGVRSDDAEHVAAVATYFDNLLRFLDAHHEGEDAVVWPRLTERCPGARGVVTQMEGEHAVVLGLRQAAGDALQAWSQSPDDVTAQQLVAAMEALHTKLDAHFSEEETEIIPLASAYMSPEEWGELPGHAMQHFTGDKVWLILGLVIDQMTAEERAAILPHLPPPVLEMMDTTGRAAYQDLVARVRGAS
jgi:hemerythrin-like domain-containing protein